jgi:hypothetical protein
VIGLPGRRGYRFGVDALTLNRNATPAGGMARFAVPEAVAASLMQSRRHEVASRAWSAVHQ